MGARNPFRGHARWPWFLVIAGLLFVIPYLVVFPYRTSRDYPWMFKVARQVALAIPVPMIFGLWLMHTAAIRLEPRAGDGRRCLECGYDLTGNTSGRCPECGMREGTRRRHWLHPRLQRGLIGFGIWLLFVTGFVCWIWALYAVGCLP